MFAVVGDPRFVDTSGISMITKNLRVCGGVACIHGTKLPVWMVARRQELGDSLAKMQETWPFVTAAQLKEALDYAVVHAVEIQQDRRDNEGQP